MPAQVVMSLAERTSMDRYDGSTTGGTAKEEAISPAHPLQRNAPGTVHTAHDGCLARTLDEAAVHDPHT